MLTDFAIGVITAPLWVPAWVFLAVASRVMEPVDLNDVFAGFGDIEDLVA